MTLEEIEEVKNAFVDAAYRAKQAGFDGVQLHGAHDYLLCEFVSPSYNKRTDIYGTDAQGRFRIVVGSLKASKRNVVLIILC